MNLRYRDKDRGCIPTARYHIVDIIKYYLVLFLRILQESEFTLFVTFLLIFEQL